MYGVHPDVARLFKDYSNNRQQMTVVNGIESNLKSVNCGMPQGSILGPLLFIIYVNDISKYIHECEVGLYADIALYYPAASYTQLILSLRIEIENVSQSLQANKLSLNVKKTNYIGTENELQSIQHGDLLTDSDEIERVTNFIYLGMALDQRLTWEKRNVACRIILKVSKLRY